VPAVAAIANATRNSPVVAGATRRG
jgi:hypothetical protein